MRELYFRQDSQQKDQGWAGKKQKCQERSKKRFVVPVPTADKTSQGSNLRCKIMLATETENMNTLHMHLWHALQMVKKKYLKLFQAENVLTNGPHIKTKDTKKQKCEE